jgi:Mg-chelatase subunit ChlD
VGRRFLYVFDRSVSMAGARLATAKRELMASLEPLERTHQFQIIFFNHQVRAGDLTGGQERIAFATERNKALAAEWVARITADGGTDRVAALLRAIAYQPDVCFFLTDDDTPLSGADLKYLRRRNRGRTAIHAIEFGNGPPHGRRNFLVELAEQSGGQYVYLNTRSWGP